MPKTIYLLTGNSDKVNAARSIFGSRGVNLELLDLDIEEIQASSSAKVARAMVTQAHKITGKPVIREDHSFFIKELGFPGPYMAYADKVISVQQLLAIVNTLDSRDAYFELAAAYVDEKGDVHEFSYQVPVVIGTEIRGSDELRWERLMMLPGETKTFAESNPEERVRLWNKNYEAIAQLIGETS
jgi:XTP/dITP diphosphohydrolase